MNNITAYKCKSCGLIMYPYHDRCLNCKKREFEQVEPSEYGKLVTFTIIEQLPWGMDERGRVLGVVQFDNGVKALGLVDVEEPKLGMKLKRGWGTVREMGGIKVKGLIFENA
jgi:uncharacterized OB-fold protein